MPACAAPWCGMLAAPDHVYCTVHQQDPTYRPVELEDDEEWVEDGTYCQACKGTGGCPECEGSGKCDHCMGDGEVEYRCTVCSETHQHECHECDGTGDCPVCVKTRYVKNADGKHHLRKTSPGPCKECKGTGQTKWRRRREGTDAEADETGPDPTGGGRGHGAVLHLPLGERDAGAHQ